MGLTVYGDITVLNHIVFVHKSQQRAAEAWCREHLGPRWAFSDNTAGRWTCFWAGNEDWSRYRFYFADESDAVVFSLKWS
jgi:hypothetical protein